MIHIFMKSRWHLDLKRNRLISEMVLQTFMTNILTQTKAASCDDFYSGSYAAFKAA